MPEHALNAYLITTTAHLTSGQARVLQEVVQRLYERATVEPGVVREGKAWSSDEHLHDGALAFDGAHRQTGRSADPSQAAFYLGPLSHVRVDWPPQATFSFFCVGAELAWLAPHWRLRLAIVPLATTDEHDASAFAPFNDEWFAPRPWRAPEPKVRISFTVAPASWRPPEHKPVKDRQPLTRTTGPRHLDRVGHRPDETRFLRLAALGGHTLPLPGSYATRPDAAGEPQREPARTVPVTVVGRRKRW